MELEDPPWMKAEIRERRRRRNKKICVAVVILSLLVVVAGLAVLLSQVLVPKAEVSSTSLQPGESSAFYQLQFYWSFVC